MITSSTAQQSPLAVVETGLLSFQIFSAETTHKRYSDVGKTHVYSRHILLDTAGQLPQLPIRLYAGATRVTPGSALSPYTERRGWYPTSDSLYAAAPLCLDAAAHGDVLRNLHLTEQRPTLPDPLLPYVKAILSRLRFTVLLPRLETFGFAQPRFDSFIAKPDATALHLGELRFTQFLPHASPNQRPPAGSQGYFLLFPSDDAIMQSISAQFFLLPPSGLAVKLFPSQSTR